MNCPNCSEETNGIKINGKNFCPLCGEPLSVTSKNVLDEVTGDKKPKAKIIGKDENIKKEIDILDAEEEVLDLIAGQNQNKKETFSENETGIGEKLPTSSNEIKKSNRFRIGHKPDVQIKEEVKEQVEEPKEPTKVEETAEPLYPFLNKEEKEEIKKERTVRKDVLKEYFKSKVNTKSQTKTKPKSKKHKKSVIISSVVIVFVLAFIGLVLYVNLYFFNPGISKNNSENAIAFTPAKASYIPAGYNLSFTESVSQNKIIYYYGYLENSEKTIEIIQENTSITDEDIFESYVKPVKGTFSNFTENGTGYWYLNEDTLIFKNDLLYQIKSSDKMTREELLKIAEGLVENKNISD